MSDKKKKKEEELKLKVPAEASVEIGYVDEQAVQNVSDETVSLTVHDGSWFKTLHFSSGYRDKDGNEVSLEIEKIKFDLEYRDDAQCVLLFSLSEMKKRLDNGATLEDVYNDMKDFILANKDTNPDEVQRAVAELLGNASDHYDEGTDNLFGISGFTRSHQGDSAYEILGKLLNLEDDEQLHGFVCSTISEFGMRLLDECGIKATMLAGGTSKTNHTTLLWQRSDGKYVQSNYDESFTLDAGNMKDAAREVYKRNLGLINNGFMYFIDNNGSYQEFSMKEEAVWGDELDKRDYNKQSVFDHTVAQKSSITGTATVSNLGSVSGEVSGTVAYGNDTVSKETTYSLGFKKSGQTSLADYSSSIGFKLDHKTERILEKGKKYSETKVVLDYTQLTSDMSLTDNNYYEAITGHRTYIDEEQVAQLREWYGNEYNRCYSIESLQGNYNWCTNYLERFDREGSHENCPISKEDYINDFLSKYKDGDGVAYNDLNDYGKINANHAAECHWENYLTNNHYNEGRELVLQQQADCKDKIDNYDAYREKYIDEQLNNLSNVAIGTHDPKQELKSFSTSHLTVFLRKVFGKEKTLLKDKGVELTKGWQLSGTLGLNDVLTKSGKNGSEAVFSSFGGDFRLAAEEGLKLDISNGSSHWATAVSGGLTADFSLKSGTLTPTVNPGVKFNGSTIFQTRINDNVTFGAGLSGYSAVNPVSVDYGSKANLQASYTPDGKSVTIFGTVSTGLEKQRIRIGGFNELTENVKSLFVSLGAQLGAKGSISINYSGKSDMLNSTRDRAIYSVAAKFNL